MEYGAGQGDLRIFCVKITLRPAAGNVPFKDSFTVYALEGEGRKTRLKKHAVNVTGLVVDGVGVASGRADCRILWYNIGKFQNATNG